MIQLSALIEKLQKMQSHLPKGYDPYVRVIVDKTHRHIMLDENMGVKDPYVVLRGQDTTEPRCEECGQEPADYCDCDK